LILTIAMKFKYRQIIQQLLLGYQDRGIEYERRSIGELGLGCWGVGVGLWGSRSG
jgi:hypothetical protein